MIRGLTALAVLAVAVIAAVISFSHIETLALANGQTLLASRALPVSIDGVIVVASMVMLDAARRGVSAPALARVMLAAGILATLSANAVSGAGHGPLGVAVAAWPAIAFIGCAETFFVMVRGRSRSVPEASPAAAPEAVPETVTQAVPVSRTGTPRPLSPRRSTRRRVVAPEVVFAQELAAGVVPSIRTVKRELRVGQDRAVQIRGQLEGLLAARSATVEVAS
jgi:Protein of unknown function (DUF2637)